MKKIGIVDLPKSNSLGIKSALKRLGLNSEIHQDVRNLSACDALVLPGVGTFGGAATFLRKSKLDEFIVKKHDEGLPVLGVCLGFQLFFSSSDESPGFAGLGLIPGSVSRMESRMAPEIPNIGWRVVHQSGASIRDSIMMDSLYYFAHSFEVKTELPKVNVATAKHDDYEFVAGLRLHNLWGAQFHPEKCHDSGLEFLSSFAMEIR